jgi:hypothetical protein
VSHIDDEHQGKLHYPTPEDFKNRNMRWLWSWFKKGIR